MICPYCKTRDFVDWRVYANAENYGGSIYIVDCTNCEKKLRIAAQRQVHIISVDKAAKDADYCF